MYFSNRSTGSSTCPSASMTVYDRLMRGPPCVRAVGGGQTLAGRIVLRPQLDRGVSPTQCSGPPSHQVLEQLQIGSLTLDGSDECPADHDARAEFPGERLQAAGD